ncbi:MAG: 2-hydroxyacyl-CoA dehydratase family protein [Smithellaceae bacterium]|jgi:bzd-type benzoyl-CoA reductase N subunit|nr:2-hydroxyacyl-CoA dehydratase family protein [Smithellaceae bacterium]NLX53450.1 2-hydroxyacyl-CoA dehydratase [Deltaproteobacteria bacterium]
MKHFHEFQQAVNDPLDYARNLKNDSGKEIVGYVCSYVPEEIILAAGAHPVRLFDTRSQIGLADLHLQSYCCSLVRGILEEGLSGRADGLDGMIFPHTCDSIQRLSDIWRMNIPAGFHLDVILPVKLDTDSARDYLTDVLRKFREDLSGSLEREITDAALEKAIATMNVIRQSIRSIYEMRSQNPRLMPGQDLYTLVRASMIMDRDRMAELLLETLAELQTKSDQAPSGKPPKRLVLAGGICNQPDIYPMIEESGGAIVWDDFCTGARYFSQMIPEGADPLSRITGRFLNRIVCPAKHMDLDSRASHLIGLVKEQNAQGVIFLLLKFCDPHAFDYPYIRQSLDKAGIPVMLMEINDPASAGGQMKTRVEAFLEML